MRNRFLSANRRHQILLSLSPLRLQILHFKRGVLGWRQAHSASLELSDDAEFVQQVQAQLETCLKPWKLPADVRVLWVLAGDILGVIPPQALAQGGIGSAIPFAASEIRSQPDLFRPSSAPSMLWIHKDWVAAIERISSDCHLEAIELFARGQLFQTQAARLPKATRIVLDADGDEQHLHLFDANGLLVRTRVLTRADETRLDAIVRMEWASLSDGSPQSAASEIKPQLLAPPQVIESASRWPEFQCHALSATPLDQRLAQLWHSDQEGIVIRAVHEDLVQQIKVVSVGIGVAGLAALGIMVWHDGQLERHNETARNQIRKDLAKVEAAKALKTKTLYMASAVEAAQPIQGPALPIQGLTQVLLHFPPPPAALLYVRADQQSIAVVGSGDNASVQALKDKKLVGYSALADMATPEFLTDMQPAIHLQAQRITETAAPAANPASAAASSTVTQ